jgi:hypothetical protein
MTVSLFMSVNCGFLQKGTGARRVEYSGDGFTSTSSQAREVQLCFPVFSACCLFFGKGHVPAGSSTAVKGARVHLRQKEEYMTVSLYLPANYRLCR